MVLSFIGFAYRNLEVDILSNYVYKHLLDKVKSLYILSIIKIFKRLHFTSLLIKIKKITRT